jgi:N,N'-diacetyllegionaminate synthase
MVKANVIAEIAQGFEGNFELSKLLIRASAKAKATIVKFQMVYADDLATPDYQYYDLFKTLEFDTTQWKELIDYAASLNIELCFDVFGSKSLQVIEELGVKLLKIHPTDINNYDLLSRVDKPEYTILLGIGGAGFTEISNSLSHLTNASQVVLLHGYQAYPTPNEYNQVSRISYLKQKLGDYSNLAFGFADHVVDDQSYSVVLNAMAYVVGATYFEKHLSFGKCVELEDFESALQPDDFKQFVEDLNLAIEAHGAVEETEYFGMSEKEETYRKNIRRSWVATRNLIAGHVLTKEDIVFKRTGDTSEVALPEKLEGMQLAKDVGIHHKFNNTDFHEQ